MKNRMLFLLQSLLVENKPAIYLGTNTIGNHLYLAEEGADFKTLQTVGFDDMDWIYDVDKSSPTGNSIYYGGLCKGVIADQFRMKVPDKDVVLKEFAEIRKRLK